MPVVVELGPTEWWKLHTEMAFFPETGKLTPETVQAIGQSIMGATRSFRCGACTEHAKSYMKLHPVENSVTTGLDAQKYVYDFHNAVNDSLSKPKPYPSFGQIREAFKWGKPFTSFGTYPTYAPGRLAKQFSPAGGSPPQTLDDVYAKAAVNARCEMSKKDVAVAQMRLLSVVAMIVALGSAGCVTYFALSKTSRRRRWDSSY